MRQHRSSYSNEIHSVIRFIATGIEAHPRLHFRDYHATRSGFCSNLADFPLLRMAETRSNLFRVFATLERIQKQISNDDLSRCVVISKVDFSSIDGYFSFG